MTLSVISFNLKVSLSLFDYFHYDYFNWHDIKYKGLEIKNKKYIEFSCIANVVDVVENTLRVNYDPHYQVHVCRV